ncbi:MAG: hypothetical protein HYZ33_03030 [Ignavibacteriales bacterium]|nr:hypothetical protein [Ignavibacteriales bacterium]
MRFIFQPVITINEDVVIPVDIFFTSEEQSYRQPFNQFGLSPRLFGWLTLHGGYFSTTLSDLTFGDTRLLGGGFDARPGSFRLSLFYGVTQQASEADTAKGFRGIYKRTMVGGKVGVGNNDKFFLDLNYLHAIDDTTSLINPLNSLAPKENAMVSLAMGFPVFENKLKFSGEVSLSAFTNDMRTKEIEVGGEELRSIFTPRSSSQLDGASKLSVSFIPSQEFSLSLNGRWIGPGYVTLGYAQLPNDVLETTIAPTIRLFENNLSIRSSFGLRYNNLRSNRLATTRRTIGSISTSIQPTETFNIDLEYSNYGMVSKPKNDTLRLDNISQTLSVSPRFIFDAFDGANSVMVAYSLQDFSDNNPLTSASMNYTTHTGTAIWSLSFPSGLTFSTTTSYTYSITPLVTLIIKNVNQTIGHQFAERKLSASLTLGYNVVTAASSDEQLTVRLSSAYSLNQWGMISFNVLTNNYTRAESSAGSSFKEYQATLNYTVSL